MKVSVYPHSNNALQVHLHPEALHFLKQEFRGGNCTLFVKEDRIFIREVDIDDKKPKKFTKGDFTINEKDAPVLAVGKYILEEVEPKVFELSKSN